MKQKANTIIFVFILTAVAIIACNQENKPEETVKAGTSSMLAYDAAMDPVNVEAPFLKMHKDTLGIKLFEVTLQPGDSVGLHTHPDHVIYIAQGGKARLYSKEGKAQEVELPTGTAMIVPTESHAGINIGTTPITFIVADIYRPRS